MSSAVFASRTFSVTDQERFATLSGDRNPIHVDARAARRTQAGAPVVHGVHGVLWALDSLCASGVTLARVSAINVQFPKFIFLDAGVEARVVRQNERGIKVEIATDGVTTTLIELKFGDRGAAPVVAQADTCQAASSSGAVARTFAEVAALSGCLGAADAESFRREFPHLSAELGAGRVGALALLSTLVGMICPGLHSIFSTFSIRLSDAVEAGGGVSWRTARTDDRFRLITMEVSGSGLWGEVQAFMRVAPIEAPSVLVVSKHVTAGEFAARTALIIGGSRGLGAVTAKLLAAGGAKVIVTYATGKSDADAVTADINAARGAGAATMISCDVHSDVAAQLASLPSDITHLYYFATPRIAQQTPRAYSRERLNALLDVYVDGFSRFAAWAAAHVGRRPLTMLYPSTAFIDQRPKGMTEYAIAKAAGEVLAADLCTLYGFTLTTPRIPRVLTDQTASILPLQTDDAVDVMLPLLRAES